MPFASKGTCFSTCDRSELGSPGQPFSEGFWVRHSLSILVGQTPSVNIGYSFGHRGVKCDGPESELLPLLPLALRLLFGDGERGGVLDLLANGDRKLRRRADGGREG